MQQEWDPAGGRFDETKLQAWKLLRNLVRDNVAESHQRLNPAVAEGVISLDVEQGEKRRTARARMNANRQIEIVGRLVDRKQIGIVQRPASFDAAEKDADRAVALGPF